MNTSLLLKHVSKKGSAYFYKKDRHHIDIKDQILNAKSIRTILECLRVVFSLPKRELEINIFSRDVADNAVIQQMEMIVALTFENGIDKIYLNFNSIIQTSPYIIPLDQSVFALGKNKDRRYALIKEKYLKEYYRESYSEKNYLRYYVKKDRRDNLINQILTDANWFFAINIQDKKYAINLAKAFTEMVDNVRHADSDCIATIKFTDHLITKKDGSHVKGYFLYVCDVSKISLFGTLKQAILDNKLYGRTKDIIEQSYTFHQNYFNKDDYSFDKYCLISVFQSTLTTSSSSGETGGKGLTDLIRAITDGSLIFNCYALSGDYVLYFKDELTVIDTNGNISFNNYGNYFTSIPSSTSFGKTAFYYPGTIFLLEIIVEDKK